MLNDDLEQGFQYLDNWEPTIYTAANVFKIISGELEWKNFTPN